jgi:hypothetical protein
VFSSEWLDIAISVVLVWFLFALVVSGINEGIAWVFALRARQLWKALSQMLDGSVSPKGLLSNLAALPVWPDRPKEPHPGGGAPIVSQLYATKTIQGLEQRSSSYRPTNIHNIPPTVFTQALLQVAMTGQGDSPIKKVEGYVAGLPDVPLKPQLQTLLNQADGDITVFTNGVNGWFDGQMNRLSHIYRKQVRVVLVFIGLLVAVAGFGLGMRSDSLRLVSDLQQDSNLRNLVVGVASQTAAADLNKAGDCQKAQFPIRCQAENASKIKSVDLAIRNDVAPDSGTSFFDRLSFLLPWGHWRAFLGVLITGVAISFGSSFWFAALKRLVGLRSTPSQASSAA